MHQTQGNGSTPDQEPPNDGLLAGRIDALFAGLGARGRVVLSHLPLTVTVVLIVAAAALFSPETLVDERFRLALLGHSVIFVTCVAVPWGRLPAPVLSVVPVLDCLAIGFTREAGGPSFNVLSLMLVFPVIWLSVGRQRSRVLLAVLGVVLSTVIPAAALGSPPTEGSMIRTIFLPLVMAAIAVSAHIVSGTLHRQRKALLRKDQALAETLAESVDRQRLLDAVLAAVGVGVWVVDKDGNNVLINRAMRDDPTLARLTEAESTTTLLLSDRATPVPSGGLPAARVARGDVFTDELIWAGDEKDQRAFSVSAHEICSRDGARSGGVITLVDVTALITALAAKDDFVGTVSHELRTPLTSILGYLELVLEEPGHEGIEAELQVVYRNATHLLGLVNDLIAVASERVDLSLQEADLARLLADVVDFTLPQAANRGLELVLEAEPSLTARMDIPRIRQVVTNLLSNAIKYSPDGGRITARAHRTGTDLVCSITDPGVGMSTEDQEQAFTKFFRSARSRETAIPGAGLGLPVSKTIVEGHGGSMSLTSAPGAGTTATFVLPAS
ncbi:HAMP domain-containing histidine kinase [Pseudarthrobacter sp. NIBRBAC000502772]|uniref:sensor histidine kinase n=1 Tax=Pseudarthrobacter sp. NIBRBAC000502772 TaxID=2590775 RepID=UPI0011302797|nr:HAMP domain-containing sensor histidine kinase [Pseudarthrobacter sp. NIBRBAC000502772]QDG65484.1 HAMP domain-containing histidine kinase [Pseudarthrobacter sp. NIBRBAC000502772]